MSRFSDKYKFVKRLAKGEFSEVVKCLHRRKNELFAAKILNEVCRYPEDLENCAELRISSKLEGHQHVLHPQAYFYEEYTGQIIFIFELMDMNLYDYMKMKKTSFSENRSALFLFQIAKGLEFLHDNGLFHRDIRPKSILVKCNGLKWGEQTYELLKIGDFRTATESYRKMPCADTESESKCWYRSPESLLTKAQYGREMDIWAAGCIFYEMLTFKVLFKGACDHDQLNKIHKVLGTPPYQYIKNLKLGSESLKDFKRVVGTGLWQLMKNFSLEAHEVLKKMLQYNPGLRISSVCLVKHKYFERIRAAEKQDRVSRVLRKCGIIRSPPKKFRSRSAKCNESENKSSEKTKNRRAKTSTELKKHVCKKQMVKTIDEDLHICQVCRRKYKSASSILDSAESESSIPLVWSAFRRSRPTVKASARKR